MNILDIDAAVAILDAELQRGEPSSRVKTPVAKYLLEQNEPVIVRGKKRWMRLENLGLGIYEVTLADIGCRECVLILKPSKRKS